MIAIWMCCAILAGVLFGVAAIAAERAARAWRLPTRFVWLAALIAAAGWPLVAILRTGTAHATAAAGVLVTPFAVGVQRASALVAESSGPHLARALDLAVLVGWGVLSALLLVRLVRAFRTLRHQRRVWRTDQVDGMTVRLSADVGPAVIGLDPMEIVLPEWTLALDRPLRAMVLRHEAEHRNARDPYLLLASILLITVMPWNVPLWWYVRRLRLAIELDCDARVLRVHPRPERYGLLLLTIAQRHAGATTRFSPALSEPASNLERRIIAMRNVTSRFTRTRALVFGAIAAVVVAIACSIPGPDQVTEPAASARDGTPVHPQRTYIDSMIEKSARPAAGNPTPVYPPALKAAHVDGEVVVQFVVDTTGHVDMSQFRVLRTSNPLFTDAIAKVLPSWTFTPADIHGYKVKQVVQMPFTFTMP